MKTLLARRVQQGWSWAELSRRCGLPVWKLRWWHKRLARIRPKPRRARIFVPVEVVDVPRADGSPLEVVTPSGFRILVPPGVTADDLIQVVKALEPSC
jgi:hypothetical protein